MSILFAGGEIGAFIPADSNAYELSTFTTRYDPAFARCCIFLAGTLTYADSWTFANTTDFWFHGEGQVTDHFTAGPIACFLNGSGTEVFRIYAASSSSIKMQYLLAGVWTDIGGSVTASFESLQVFDVHVDVAGDAATLYLAGTQRATGSAELSGITNIATIRLRSCNQQCWSQVIGANESTIGKRVKTVPATGAGAAGDFTGTYTEIDEIVYADVDFINSATNDQVELFSHSTTVPTGYVVNAVIVSARAKRGASGPQHIELALRSAGTTYLSSSLALGVGYSAFVNVWATDPATSADFLVSNIAALQFGVKSIA